MLTTIYTNAVAEDKTGLTYTGEAKSWSIENYHGGYYFKCFDKTGNTMVTLHPTKATTKQQQLIEVARVGKIAKNAIKTYTEQTFIVYEFTKKEWPKRNYYIYLKLKGKDLLVKWSDRPGKPGSGKAIFQYLKNIKPKT